jgi:hypothetical protein
VQQYKKVNKDIADRTVFNRAAREVHEKEMALIVEAQKKRDQKKAQDKMNLKSRKRRSVSYRDDERVFEKYSMPSRGDSIPYRSNKSMQNK